MSHFTPYKDGTNSAGHDLALQCFVFSKQDLCNAQEARGGVTDSVTWNPHRARFTSCSKKDNDSDVNCNFYFSQRRLADDVYVQVWKHIYLIGLPKISFLMGGV